MTGIEAISAIGTADPAPLALRIGSVSADSTTQLSGTRFADVLMTGLRDVDQKIATADKLVQQFALDDSVPVHQVTMALAEAKLAVELAMQVRTRLVEGFRELMNTQL